MITPRILFDAAPVAGGGGAAAPVVQPPAGGSPPAAPDGGGQSQLEIGESFDKYFDDGGTGGSGQAPAGGGTPAGAPAAAAAAPAKPAAGAPQQPAAKPAAAKPDDKGGKPAQPAHAEFDEVEGVQVPRFKSDKEFRGWGLNGYKKANAIQKEADTLKQKITELERRPSTSGPEQQQLTSRISALEKQLQEKEDQIRYHNYEGSQEYVAKYQKPFYDGMNAAHSDVLELLVSEPDTSQAPVDGKYPTKERQGTQSDFEEIYHLPLGPATKLAKEKFGDAYGIVLQHRNSVRNLAKNAVNALNEWKTTSKQRQEQEQQAATARSNQIESFWTQVNQKLSEDPRAKEWWGQETNDKEINEAIQRGLTMADQRFSDSYDKLSLQDQVILDAHIRQRVAGFYRRGVMISRIKAELDSIKERLAKYESGEPGKPAAGGEGAPQVGESEGPMSEFEKRL